MPTYHSLKERIKRNPYAANSIRIFRNMWQRYCESLSLFTFKLHKKEKANTAALQALRNIHSGKRCFIIGNGPSLEAKDLQTLYEHNEICFAANKISAIFPDTDWRPDYMVVTDARYQRTLVKMISHTPARLKFVCHNSYFFSRKITGNVVYLYAEGRAKKVLFSEDISKILYSHGTVTSASLQIAAYMGFREIYLLGMDHSYPVEQNKDGTLKIDTTIKGYFKNLENTQGGIGYIWQMEEAFTLARNYAQSHGISIKNATYGGKLEIFDRIAFDSLFPSK